jgi:hypothetical protein
MIYDFGTEIGPLAYPGSGVPIVYSADSIDLAPNDGVPALFGTGERLFMQFEVSTAFATSTAPIANFGVAIGSASTLTTDSHILAMTGGSITGDFIGFDVGDLTLGSTFHLPIPFWEDILENNTVGAWPHTKSSGNLTTFRGLRYMGIVISIPNSNETGPPTFTGGAVKARIIKDPSGTAVLSNVYGSRMTVA